MTMMQAVKAEAMLARVVEDRRPGEVRRTVEVSGAPDAAPRTLFYAFRGEVLPGPLDRLDFAAVALVFHAMRAGRDLHVAGPVSRVLLANLQEFQHAWAKWHPKLYRPVRITAAEEVAPGAPADDRAVLAYSGGVDANFTLLRHIGGHAGPQNRSIAAALLIHGFDFPLSQRDAFAASARRAGEILGRFDVPLVTVETNWNEATRTNWEMEFAVGVAACAWQFAGRASAALLGSCEDYGSLVLPWGSNPVTNPLLDAGDFALRTDGTGFTRCEKVALIARDPYVADRLRVCWQDMGSDGANCGRCEKCIRTKLNFMANGARPGASLSAPVTPGQVRGVRARNPAQMAFLHDIVRTAEQNGITEPWVAAVRVAIARSRIEARARDLGRPLKAGVRRVLRSALPARRAS